MRDLSELFMATVELCGDMDGLPHFEKVCLNGKWALARLDDGRSGRAFRFFGEHAVYGRSTDASLIGLDRCMDRPVTALLDWASTRSGALTEADRMLRRSILAATLNALSSGLNAPDALQKRGCPVASGIDYSFLRSDDRVVVVGAGMVIHEAAEICGHVDIVDMRTPLDLRGVLVDGSGVSYGPPRMDFHAPDQTADLFSEADVIYVTGCSIINDTLFDLVDIPRHARDFVLFGPSAQAPFELLAGLGVSRVLASRVTDGVSLIRTMFDGFSEIGSQGYSEAYTADIRCLRGDG